MTVSAAWPSGRFRRVPRAAVALLSWLLAAALGAPAWAQGGAADVDAVLTLARQQLDAAQKTLAGDVSELPDVQLLVLRGNAMAGQVQADAAAAQLDPQLAGVQARLDELGKLSAGQTEAPDIAAQRKQLEQSRSDIDAQIKLARLLSVEAQQVSDQIGRTRRAQFQARLFERTDSILSAPFWAELRTSFARDAGRLAAIRNELLGAAARASAWRWAGVALACAVLVALRIWLGGALARLAAARLPHGRLRRSVSAAVRVAVSVVVPGLIGMMVAELVLRANGPLSDELDRLIDRGVHVLFFGGFVDGLGSALLSAKRPSWRLPPIPDGLASGLRWFPRAVALAVVLGWIAERLPELVNASLATTVAVQCIAALALGIVMGLGVLRSEQLRRRAVADPDRNHVPPRPFWAKVLAIGNWSLLALSLAGLLIGYVALGSFLVKQLAWIAIVLCTAYLLSVLIEDLCMGLIANAPPAEAAKDGSPAALSPGLRDQIAVLLSGVGRALVTLFALTLILSRFGEGPTELFQRTGRLTGGIVLGEVSIRPAAVLQAVVVMTIALFAVRFVKRWMTERYLPTTSLDPGMQLSAATLFGYAGSVTAVALAMSAVGVGLERVAWVASALSVGIGFGLQAVVQNFVSGLILLAERPVKVGDWVSLGGVEGDIRRINVRATEIQMGDRSTVIVPNSEFITKTVRNVTHANPLGLVQIKLPMPLDSDVERVRDLMLGAFVANEDLLDNPAPSVALDGIENGQLVFNATGFVNSPRATYNARSALLFDILARLRAAKLPMSKPPTMLLGAAPAAAVGAPASETPAG